MAEFGSTRAGRDEPAIEVRAPGDHVGLTLARTPRLWWVLEEKTARPVELTVIEADGIDPLIATELPRPGERGLQLIDLARLGAALEPGIDYHWTVSLVVDPQDASRNPVAVGSLRVVAPDDPRRREVALASPLERGHVLARLGLWYDAFDHFASLAAAHPGDTRIVRHRDHLVELRNLQQ